MKWCALGVTTAFLLACGGFGDADLVLASPVPLEVGQTHEIVLTVKNTADKRLPLTTVEFDAQVIDRVEVLVSRPAWAKREADGEEVDFLYSGIELEPGEELDIAYDIRPIVSGRLTSTPITVRMGEGASGNYATHNWRVAGDETPVLEIGEWSSGSVKLGEPFTLSMEITNHGTRPRKLIAIGLDPAVTERLGLKPVWPTSLGTDAGGSELMVDFVFDETIPPGQTLKVRLAGSAVETGEFEEIASLRFDNTGIFGNTTWFKVQVDP